MKTNPLFKNAFTESATRSGTVTSKMVRDRAEALAVIKGRYASDVTHSDLAQARWELKIGAPGNA